MLHYWVCLTHSGYQPVTLAPVAPVAHFLHEVVNMSPPYHIATIQSHTEGNRPCLSFNATGYPMVTLGRKVPGKDTIPWLKMAPFCMFVVVMLLLGLMLLHIFPSIWVQLMKAGLQIPTY